MQKFILEDGTPYYLDDEALESAITWRTDILLLPGCGNSDKHAAVVATMDLALDDWMQAKAFALYRQNGGCRTKDDYLDRISLRAGTDLGEGLRRRVALLYAAADYRKDLRRRFGSGEDAIAKAASAACQAIGLPLDSLMEKYREFLNDSGW